MNERSESANPKQELIYRDFRGRGKVLYFPVVTVSISANLLNLIR